MKKHFKQITFLLSMLLSATYLHAGISSAGSVESNYSEIEKLTRGVVALPSESGGEFISWRMMDTDPLTTTFDLLRDGQVIAKNLGNRTNFTDPQGTSESQYQVVVKVDGKVVETTEPVNPWSDVYKRIKLDRPQGGIYDGVAYSYHPYECSVGDVDGDGIYELFVKWNPTNAKDNGDNGYTGNVFLDCYSIDGTKLWRIDLGVNIRAGAHYTQFLVYDFNGDGRAEMICKTAPGSIDGQGNYVNQAADESEIRQTDNLKDWRSEKGRVIGGQEYLTVFDGQTGKAIHTVFYNPNRNTEYGGEADWTFNWEDRPGKTDNATYGNRGERYVACVAYLGGRSNAPSAIMCRGYYTCAFLWAVDFDGRKLSTKWLHASRTKTEVERTDSNGSVETRTYSTNTFGTSDSYSAYGQGNHHISVADVDGDGCDEIIFGAATIDNDGWLLYTTGLGHGNALHVADIQPDRPGLEVYRTCENSPYGCEMHDARTGEKLYHRTGEEHSGNRCVAADIDAAYRGFEFWFNGSNDVCDAEGHVISQNRPAYSFRTYWDGDLQDELFEKGKIYKWNGSSQYLMFLKGKQLYYYGADGCGDKDSPALQADLFGDWREELICWNKTDSVTLNIYTTNIPSKYRVPTLMHDHNYRLAVAWQNVGYNQPPHLSYYLPDSDFSYPGAIEDEAAPDLSDYKLANTLDFGSMDDTFITIDTNAQKGTAWESGNKKQQKVYNAVTPETLHDVIAFQGTYSGSGTKGWRISSVAGGLVTEEATRSAAMLNLKKGDIVIFESTNCIDGTLTITDGSGKADGPFTFTRSNDGTKVYCTMTADGQIGFCGAWRYTGAIKSIQIYTPKPMFTYTVNEVCGGQTVRSTAGSAIEGTEVSVPYRWYNVQGGHLYKRDAKGGNKKLEYNHYFTLAADGQTEMLDYDHTSVENVAYLSEGEDIEGMTLCTSANAGVSSSNSAAAYAASGNVALTTLEPGMYRLTAVIFDSSKTPDSRWSFLADDKEVANLHCTKVNKEELTSDVFALTAPATLYIAKGGDGNKGIDLVYIVREGDAPSGIAAVKADNGTSGTVYDLQGRRFVQPTKGVYVSGGRKVVVK